MKAEKIALAQALALVLTTSSALAEVTIGVIVSATGPAASLGVTSKAV